MTIARNQQVSLSNTRYYHCISRCVRRAFLCGFDVLTGKNYDHRKRWMIQRIHELASVFTIRICAYAFMSTHYHLVVYIDNDLAEKLTDQEVAERWGKIFKRKTTPSASSIEEENKASTVSVWRDRLKDISWFMRCLNEYIARLANKEDECKGRFWEGRFKSQALIDKSALLACMVYVDLNPIRAKLAETPEESEFTSIWERIQTDQVRKKKQPIDEAKNKKTGSSIPSGGSTLNEKNGYLTGLMEFQKNHLLDQKKDAPLSKESLPIGFNDYLELLDSTGRAVRCGKKGTIPSHISPILERLAVHPKGWLKSVTQFESCFCRVAGKLSILKKLGKDWGVRWLKGQQGANDLYLSPT